MLNPSRRIAVLLTPLLGAGHAIPALADVTPHAAMLRYPDISADQVCFVYANDIWVAPRAGGQAAPLASPPGVEQYPKFSPDGKTIAFVGNYDGGRDLYTMPAAGGVPVRVTHHPAGEALSDWTADNRLIFIFNGLAGLQRAAQLFTVPAAGGLPTKLPVPYGGFGAISPDGTWLAYTPHSTDNRTWKRYRGGMATDIWLFNLKDNSSRKITDWEGTDTIPMWVPGGDGKFVYYLSDNGPEHRLNIWSFDTASGQRAQITTYKDDDIRWPSIGPAAQGKSGGSIIFQLGAKLMVLDLGTKQASEIVVTIPGDRPKIKPRTVNAAPLTSGATISPSGKRVVVEARGDLWSLPSKEGVTRNLTRTDGTAERDPSWSPDGKWIAYFSDASGEYELWVRAADSKPPEPKEDEKKDADKKDEKAKDEKAKDDKAKDEKAKDEKEGEKKDDAAKQPEEPPAAPAPKPEPRKLTDLGAGFRYNPTWSPDSKHIAFVDQNGRYFLTEVESGKTTEIDKDPWMNQSGISWSSDSQWLTYSKADNGTNNGCLWIYNAKTGTKQPVTSPMFNSSSPAFDRKGDWLFFHSNRSINAPTYADLDTTYIYNNTDVLLMAPLRADVKSPWLPKSDEEELKPDKKKDEKKDDAKKDDSGKEEPKKDGEKKDEPPKEEAKAAKADDGVSGAWEGTATGGTLPPQGLPFTMKLKVAEGGSCTVSVSSVQGAGDGTGTYDKATGAIQLTFAIGDATVTFNGTLKNQEGSGTWTLADDGGAWTAKRTAADTGENGKDEKDKAADKEAPKEVKIDFEGFEARAILIPVTPGSFGQIAVADGEKIIYNRQSTRGGGGEGGIKIYNYTGDEKEEKAVTGNGGFALSADGKKLLVVRGPSVSVMDASAGGGKTLTPPTSGMSATIQPRNEWKQIFQDAWRLQRDFFYEPTLHGVDWKKMREHYGAMIDDCASREDVAYVLGEMISELNIGHAYILNPGDIEQQPSEPVGLLGCDYTFENGAYKIAKLYRGGPWDSDAVGPLQQPGINVKEGEYLLAVNGVPVDTTQDPWAALVGMAGKPTTLTIGPGPTMDGKQREVLVEPIASEANLRYRAWIEHNRAYVDKQSGGKIGYIYVPNTGVDGQSDLYRQFFGQRDRAALIIDERWNAGGQIPSRFIELLNRPVSNYYARRDGNDWPWPPDSHPGPKCMLVNGLAGSGGDAFPWLFKHAKIGKVIGMRTWGGLVGISGNPGFIDGGAMSVPTFGFYELDGTWGVEGHGVDPDIVVIDDPAKMVNGGDPQLDVAIATMTDEIAQHPYIAPKRPVSPDRSGMGLPEKDH